MALRAWGLFLLLSLSWTFVGSFGGQNTAFESVQCPALREGLQVWAPLQEVQNDLIRGKSLLSYYGLPCCWGCIQRGEMSLVGCWLCPASASFQPAGMAGHCGYMQGPTGARRQLIQDRALYKTRRGKGRRWGHCFRHHNRVQQLKGEGTLLSLVCAPGRPRCATSTGTKDPLCSKGCSLVHTFCASFQVCSLSFVSHHWESR